MGRPLSSRLCLPHRVANLAMLQCKRVRKSTARLQVLTSVDVSPDLSHAKVFYTILEKDKLEDTAHGLRRAAGFLRSQLAKRLKLYTTPELRFEYDESVERGDRISRLIDSVKPRK